MVVLTGAGDRFFCIGGEKEPNDGQLHYHSVPPVVDLYGLIDLMPMPVIAMVNGFAVGGGNVLANMCDLTVASEQATFRQVGPMMGSYDAGFGTWYLEDSVGRKRAREIWYLNRKYSAKEAQALGLVTKWWLTQSCVRAPRLCARSSRSAGRRPWPRSRPRSTPATTACLV